MEITMIIEEIDDMTLLDNDNKFIGTYPKMINSTINLAGKGNILFCEAGTVLESCRINFFGNNSVVYISSNNHRCKLNLSVHNNVVFYIGKNNYMNGALNITLSSGKHCFIGDYGLFSTEITIRNSDPHLVYNCSDKKRINPNKSVFLGDHIWVGQNAIILKGTQIDSGSIIGAGSVVAGKRIKNNESWAGNPCKKIRDGVFWDETCVHSWDEETILLSENYENFAKARLKNSNPNQWIYKFNKNDAISFDEIEQSIDNCTTADERLEFLISLNKNKKKNRFVHFGTDNAIQKKNIISRIIRRLKRIFKIHK